MASTSDAVPPVTLRSGGMLVVLFIFSISIALAAACSFNWANSGKSLFSLSNLVGPTAESLLRGGGLTVCTDAMGMPGDPICFHAARMPLASLMVGLGIRLIGDHYIRVAVFKALLLLLPVELAIYLAWLRISSLASRRIAVAALLLAPFAMAPFLACVVNLQVEEGYSYSFLALAVAVLLFSAQRGWGRALLFAATLDCLFLAKSAMAPAVVVLLVGYLLREQHARQRLTVLALVLAAPVGWALYQHHASARYSIGTSLDGINLHKGNNPWFLEHYPPPSGDSLDRFDATLSHGQHFSGEWSFNDYHRRAALDYIRHHPGATLQGELRKLDVLLFSVRKIGSSKEHGAMLLWETGSLVLFRLMLWAAMISAIYALFEPPDREIRLMGGLFLALVAACILPYLAGFAYTRHAGILIYPSALMCCRMLAIRRNTKVGLEMLTG